jgi:hypothetical protein
MSSSYELLGVTDFSHPDFVCSGGHAAHATDHVSGLPLDEGTVACWREGIDVISGHYATRIRAIATTGSSSTLWTPLFNRKLLSSAETLISALYFSDTYVSDNCLSVGQHWAVFRVSDLQPAINHPFLQSLGTPLSARNPYWMWIDHGTRFFIDTISILELIIAQDEPLFRLLMSPFRDLAAQAARFGEHEAVICYLDKSALAQRGERFRAITPPRWRSVDIATCIVHWLLSDSRRRELQSCAESVRTGTSLYVPRTDVAVMTSVNGYEHGSNMLVRTIRPLESTPLWPCSWKSVAIVDKPEVMGQAAVFSPIQRRTEGTFRQGPATVRKLDRTEVERVLHRLG